MMKIQTESYFDFKTFRAYFFYLLFKRWPARIIRIFLIISSFLFTAYLVIDYIRNGRFDIEIFSLGILVLAINSSYFLITLLMAVRLYKKNQKIYLTPTIYQFESNYFLIGLKDRNIQDGVKIEYTKIRKIEETKDYFYIFLDNGRAHVLRKDLFKTDHQQLRVLLMNYFKQNYILKCK